MTYNSTIRQTLLLIAALILSYGQADAQKTKKIIAQAKAGIKSGLAQENHEKAMKEYVKAENAMWGLLKDSTNHDNEKVWLTLYDAIQAQYDVGNEKLYLKQPYDTAAHFKTTSKMFDVLIAFDSIDAKPDKKGQPKLKYRAKHADILDFYRPNLFYGGAYYVNKADFPKAYEYFEKYLTCAQLPILQAYDYEHKDTMMPTVAYWALYSAYRMDDADKAFRYQQLALRDTLKLSATTQYLAELYKMKGDTAEYVRQLNLGFARDPGYPFFFPRLMDYYNSREQNDSMMTIVDQALEKDSTNALYRFAKSTVYLNTGKYKECMDICHQLIEENDSFGDAYYNIGLAYFNQAVELDKVAQRSRQKRRTIRELYEKSLPYIEKYRELAPEQKERWVPVLYILYLNLNMGDQFDEIDRIRNCMLRK